MAILNIEQLRGTPEAHVHCGVWSFLLPQAVVAFARALLPKAIMATTIFCLAAW